MKYLPWFFITCLLSAGAEPNAESPGTYNCYRPIDGGWELRVSDSVPAPALSEEIGVVQDNPRLHRRPLYPPAVRTLVWSEDQIGTLQRYGFRPVVLAYVEPRFLFDFHSAGGLLGHLRVGLVNGDAATWLDQWTEINIKYIDGRMEYELQDSAFPGVTVRLCAVALAKAAGLVLRIDITGGTESDLVWAYGGGSAFFTNWAMNAPEFSYAPEQCAKDALELNDVGFTLRRSFDENDMYMKEVFAAARYLPGWSATVHAGSDWNGRKGFGAPAAFADAPRALLDSSEWSDRAETRTDRVAVETMRVENDAMTAYVVVGMGGNVEAAIADPRAALESALARNQNIATRIETHTPDPYLDSAVRMMAFSSEGIWGDTAILHGAWSWRFAYLGWRGWYGPLCYGWTDRIRKSIENHTTLGLVREGPEAGALGSLLEYNPGVFYNMNEVFLDQVRQYYEYTDDVELMRRIFPVLREILAWEDRRLQPGNADLYENSLNTWISDSHWYVGGQCSQASAYMLGANRFLGDLAERLGEDPTPYREKAERIRAALQEKLWMPERGVFAEYVDTRGHAMLHPEPELPTIYHTAEFGAAEPSQIASMLRWADANLTVEKTPGDGRLVWSSNWYPNHGRSYTHSTYELAYAEELNFALTNYLAGRADEAYAILRGVLCGIYNGPTPGGLACHAYVDGRQRANDEFADAISMFGRTVVEGLFGIAPNRPKGYVSLSPQFPETWTAASIESPALSYAWRRRDGEVTIEWSSPIETSIHLRLPLPAHSVREVQLDGNPVDGRVEPGFAGVNWLEVETPSGRAGAFLVRYTSEPVQHGLDVPRPPDSQAERERWSPPEPNDRDLAWWHLVDLTETYNARVTEVLAHAHESAIAPPLPASRVGFDYWRQHLLQGQGNRNVEISDAAWRSKVDADGVAWTTDGIPFKTSRDGLNIGVITRAGGFPEHLDIPVGAQGEALYLMLSGMTFPVQSHVVNLRVLLRYADGTEDSRDLVNPYDLGDCWSTWCGRYHDCAATGFENIGGRSGPAGSAEVADLTQPVALDTEAQLLRVNLRSDVELRSLTIEAYANDVVFGVMGASVLK